MNDTTNLTPNTFAARVHDLMTRLNLNESRAAAYLGVPIFTLHKWVTGQRKPGAAVKRLLDVLGTIEVMAPSLHDSFLPPPSKVKRVKDSQ